MKADVKSWIRLALPPLAAFTIGGFTASQFIEWMATTMGVATLVPIVVEFVKLKFDLSGKDWKVLFLKAKAARFITWGLCIVAIVISHYVGWGFQNISILSILFNMLVAGFVANGYYKYEWVQLLLAKVTDNLEKIKALKEKG